MTSNQRRRVEPLPSDPIGKRLCQTFPYTWHPIVKANDPESNWKTLAFPLRPHELWLRWQDSDQIVGVRFGSETAYGMIDLDVSGIYHPNQNAEALPLIRAALETIGITRTFLMQSSSSGGLHLWIPLPEEVPTFWFGATIRQCLEAQEFEPKQGQLEIFPNCKAYARKGEFTQYQAHRLPLQPETGSQLLDDNLKPIAGGLERFFEVWEHCADGQDIEQLRQTIAQAKTSKKKRWSRRNSLVVDSWRVALESEIEEGWTDYGQTNYLLKQIACYGVVVLGLQGEALAEYVQTAATHASGYEQWCRHQHEITLRCTAWARAAEGYYWALGTERKREGNIHRMEDGEAIGSSNSTNRQRAEDAQSRIVSAINQLKETGELLLYKTKTALENAIVKLARCSKQTTRKYIHLWYGEDSAGQQVCTPSNEQTSAAFQPAPATPQKSLGSASDNKLHTQEYMKGLTPLADSGLDIFQNFSLRGGAGGLSTTLENATSEKLRQNTVLNGTEVIASTPSSNHPKPKQSRRVEQQQSGSNPGASTPTSTLGTPAPVHSDDLRNEFGCLIKQLGWSLEQTKEYIGLALGKTLQSLVEDDWLLLLYQLRNLVSS